MFWVRFEAHTEIQASILTLTFVHLQIYSTLDLHIIRVSRLKVNTNVFRHSVYHKSERERRPSVREIAFRDSNRDLHKKVCHFLRQK